MFEYILSTFFDFSAVVSKIYTATYNAATIYYIYTSVFIYFRDYNRKIEKCTQNVLKMYSNITLTLTGLEYTTVNIKWNTFLSVNSCFAGVSTRY